MNFTPLISTGLYGAISFYVSNAAILIRSVVVKARMLYCSACRFGQHINPNPPRVPGFVYRFSSCTRVSEHHRARQDFSTSFQASGSDSRFGSHHRHHRVQVVLGRRDRLADWYQVSESRLAQKPE
jgi:hypothetical protein